MTLCIENERGLSLVRIKFALWPTLDLGSSDPQIARSTARPPDFEILRSSDPQILCPTLEWFK